MRLHEHIMQDGHQVPVDGIDRGMLIVHTYEQWIDAYKRYMNGRMKLDVVVFSTVGAIMVMVSVLFIPFLGLMMILVVGLVALTEVLSYRATLKVIKGGGALPGVYTLGVELPIFPLYASRLFIPWTQMEDAWVKPSRMVDDVLFIAVLESRWRWRAPGRLLGQEGMQAVMARARGPHPIDIPEVEQAAPRLVVYSSEGAKTESVPEDV